MKKQNYLDYEKNPEFIKFMQSPFDLSNELIALRFVSRNSKVLSAGCGAGREVKYLVRWLGCDVTAIDISKNMLMLSERFEPYARYILADMTKFKSKEKFDYIICLWNTINYLSKEDRRKFIDLSFENLKYGGKLIIESGNRFSNWRTFIRSFLNQRGYYYNPSEIDYWFHHPFNSKWKIEKLKLHGSVLIIAERLVPDRSYL